MLLPVGSTKGVETVVAANAQAYDIMDGLSTRTIEEMARGAERLVYEITIILGWANVSISG